MENKEIKKVSISINNLISSLLFGLTLVVLSYTTIIALDLINKWILDDAATGIINSTWTLVGIIVANILMGIVLFVRNKSIKVEDRNTSLNKVFSFILFVNSVIAFVSVFAYVIYMILVGRVTETGPYIAAFAIFISSLVGAISFARLKDCKKKVSFFLKKCGEGLILGLSVIVMIVGLISLNPRHTAAKSIDMDRLSQIYNIQDQAIYYLEDFGSLPKDLKTLATSSYITIDKKEMKDAKYEYKIINNSLATSSKFDLACYNNDIANGYSVAQAKDYCTKSLYSGKATFSVCANFDGKYEAPKVDENDLAGLVDYSYWNHDKGVQCYNVDITTEKGGLDYDLKPTPEVKSFDYNESYYEDGYDYENQYYDEYEY